MSTDCIRRRIGQLLDEADQATIALNWSVVRGRAQAVLAFDPENADAKGYLAAAERPLGPFSPALSPSGGLRPGPESGKGEDSRRGEALPETSSPVAMPTPANASPSPAPPPPPPFPLKRERAGDRAPTSFANGSYAVKPFLGEGGSGPAEDPEFTPRIAASEAELRRPAAELRKEAMGHLDTAIAAFRDMKKQPSLGRALKRKELLKV